MPVIDPNTQIGPDGERHTIGDVPEISDLNDDELFEAGLLNWTDHFGGEGGGGGVSEDDLDDAVDDVIALLRAGAPTDADTLNELDGLVDALTAIVAGKQASDSDLTAIAALTTTTYGRALLALVDAASGRTALGLGSAATSSIAAFDAAGAAASAQAASQPLDSDLTAVAALSTTSFGRGVLALADAAALRAGAGLVLGTDIYSKTAVDTIVGDLETAYSADFDTLQDQLDALRVATANSDIVPDLGTAGLIKWALDTSVLGGTRDATFGSLTLRGKKITSARCMTVTALPACTYNNTNGTLTGDANGALATQDGSVTLLVDERIVVNTQASKFQHGVYTQTQAGTGSLPFILTRVAELNTAAEFANGVIVHVTEGDVWGGKTVTSQPKSGITLGTTSIVFMGSPRPHLSPADMLLGFLRDRRFHHTHFTQLQADLTTTASRIPGTEFTVFLSGTVAKGAQITDGTREGVIDINAGSDATGYCGVMAGLTGFTFSLAQRMYLFAPLKTPAVSTGSNTFLARFGAGVALTGIGIGNGTVGTALWGGLYYEWPNDGTTNIWAITKAAQTAETSQNWTRSGTVVTVTTTAHGLIVGDVVNVTASSQTTPLPVAAYVVVTVPTADTYTITGVNSGATSGTATTVRSINTRTDTGITQGTIFRNMSIEYDPYTQACVFKVGTVTVATHTTHLPDALLMPAGIEIKKSLGSNTVSIRADSMIADLPAANTAPLHVP